MGRSGHTPYFSGSGGYRRRRRQVWSGRQVAGLFSHAAMAAFFAVAFIALASEGLPSRIDPTVTSAYAPDDGTAHPRRMPVCGYGKRVNCVVDGDTFWLDGEKIRIANIDAPEIRGRCDREKRMARNATLRLADLLQNRPIRIAENGTDRFGRTLAIVRTDSGDVGAKLVAESLAVSWHGRRQPAQTWCGP